MELSIATSIIPDLVICAGNLETDLDKLTETQATTLIGPNIVALVNVKPKSCPISNVQIQAAGLGRVIDINCDNHRFPIVFNSFLDKNDEDKGKYSKAFWFCKGDKVHLRTTPTTNGLMIVLVKLLIMKQSRGTNRNDNNNNNDESKDKDVDMENIIPTRRTQAVNLML